MSASKKVPRCECCCTVKNPRYAIIDTKTQEVMRKLCRNCASNVDKVFELLKNPRARAIGSVLPKSTPDMLDPNTDIPF